MRIFLITCCAVLVLINWCGAQEGKTEYFAVFMEGMKVGHATHSRVAAEGKVTTTEEVSITMSRTNVPVSMRVTETSVETADGRPMAFEVVQDFSMMSMKVSGTVDERGVVQMTTTTMGAEQKSSFEWPRGALMAEGLRLLELGKGLKEGLEYTAKIFSPGSMQAFDARVQIGAKRNVDLLGRVVALTEVRTTLSVPGAGEIVSTGYVNDNLELQKNVTPVMGMQIEMVACGKEFALGENDVFEFVNKMVLASPKALVDVRSAKSISYLLRPTSEAGSFAIPSGDNQSVRLLGDGGIVVTVEPVSAPAGMKFPYRGKDEAILDATEATRFLQSDNKEVIELARRAVGGTSDAAEAVRRIESFVGDYIAEKDFSVGFASAAEVAVSKQGDCSEHAVLVAAMCRAVGIPARVVTGLVYAEEFAGRKDVFGCHAWAEAYVGDKWVGLDATKAPNGFGAGHIALAAGDGDSQDLLGMASALGKFQIEKVTVNKGR